MRATTPLIILSSLAVGACSTPGGPYPSLQPRAGEAVDPRLPINRPMNDRPVTPELSTRLAALVSAARDGDAAFAPAAARAEQLAKAASGSRGESWVSAQEALSAAIAAAGPTRVALGDIDEIASTALRTQGGIAPNDLAAIQNASGEVTSINERQTNRVKAIQQRLGL